MIDAVIAAWRHVVPGPQTRGRTPQADRRAELQQFALEGARGARRSRYRAACYGRIVRGAFRMQMSGSLEDNRASVRVLI
jgi:hypothetical protein